MDINPRDVLIIYLELIPLVLILVVYALNLSKISSLIEIETVTVGNEFQGRKYVFLRKY